MTALVTKDGDLQITDNNLVLSVTNSNAEIEQRLQQNLQFFLGEWFLNTALGIPWLEMVFVKGVAASLIEAVFKEAILNTQGVIGLERFDPLEYEPSSRELTVNFTVRTVNSELIEMEFRQ